MLRAHEIGANYPDSAWEVCIKHMLKVLHTAHLTRDN